MDRKQKQYLRAKVCQLMDEGKADEAKKWMDLLLVDENFKPAIKQNKHGVTLTDADGHVVEFKSIDACAEAFKTSREKVMKAIAIGTPIKGVFKGYAVEGPFSTEGPKSIFAVIATSPSEEEIVFPSVKKARLNIGLSYINFKKSLETGEKIRRGTFKGWTIRKVSQEQGDDLFC